MSLIEMVSNSFAEKITSELALDQDKKAVMAYGTFAIIQIVVSITLVIMFGLIFNVLYEALIISFSISILRKYSGGVHASLPAICNFVGTVVSVGLAIIIINLYLYMNIWMVTFIAIVTFLGAFVIIYKVVPVDSIAKPIKNVVKRKRMKKRSIFVICFFFVIVILLLLSQSYLLSSNKKLSEYALCICGGVDWQVFTLTKIGFIILTKVDTFLNQIFSRGRGFI